MLIWLGLDGRYTVNYKFKGDTIEKLLEIYIKSAIGEKTKLAMCELNRIIRGNFGDQKMKIAVDEYARCVKMENDFDEFCENSSEDD